MEDGPVIARRTSLEPNVNSRAIARAAHAILASIETELAYFEGPQAREAVLLRILTNPICNDILYQFMLKEGKASQEVVVGLVQSLFEVKHSNSKVKLVTKHAIFTAVVSSELGSRSGAIS